MDNIAQYIGIIIFVIIFIRIYASAKKASRQAQNVSQNQKTGSAVRTKRVSTTPSKPSQPAYIGAKPRNVKSPDSTSLRDDRNNDWLAKQLRDEHKAFKIASDMFGLKIEHAAHCDARLLKNYHHLNCDAGGVDTARGK